MRSKFLRTIFGCCFWAIAGAGLLHAQNASIEGTVLDENGEGLVGATVQVESTGKGMLSGADGSYRLEGLSAGENVLLITYMGYEAFRQVVELADGGTEVINVTMEVEGARMDDVIIVGYGTERKREMTGSISKINSRELNDIPGTSFEATLQGKAAGVQVIQGSGVAGSGAVVRVRGINSISAGGDPLYVIDGIPITQNPFLNGDRGGQNNNPLSSINPADIESIEILKDAAAAAIYGSRGANGVILVTTKRGTSGKPKFSLTTRTGISRPTKLLDFLNTDEWVQMYLEAWENDGNVGLPDFLPGGYTVEEALANGSTDWQNQTVGTGLKQEYGLSMRQGTKNFKTYAGISYLDNESYLLGNSYRRYTGRLNIDWNILSNLKLSASTSASWGRNNRISQAWEGSLGTAQSTALPFYTLDQANSDFGYPGNPINRREHIDWRTVEKRSINTVSLEYKPISALTVSLNGSYDYMDLGDHQFEDTLWTNWYSVARNYATQVKNWNVNGYATYDFDFLPKNHKLSVMAGTEAQQWRNQTAFMQVSDVSEHLYLDWEGTDNSDTIQSEAVPILTTFQSLFGRINYTLNDKYLFKVSFRTDGSSRFGKNNRYGYFPAAGVGWIVSEENFWKNNIGFMNFFKLKASAGLTGNAEIDNYLHFGRFDLPQTSGITYNGDSIQYPVNLENPDLQWETALTIDAGFEAGFFQDRITTEFSFYNRESKNVLLNARLQSSTGWKSRWINVGRVRNRGVEWSITSRNMVGDFKWTTNLNVARNVNTVVDVGTAPPDALAGSGDTRVIEGYPIGVNYLVRFDHVDAATGLPVFLDPDGNETMQWSESNRVVVGNVQPDLQGGLRNSFEYKGFDLNFLWTFTLGGKIYDDAAKRQLGVVADWTMRRELIDRWTGPGSVDPTYPRLTLDPTTYGGMGSEWFYNTTQWLYDGTYARLKSITLGYNVPLKREKKWSLQRLRFYVSSTNLLTFTKYPGADPEIVRDHNGPQGRNISPNVTYLTPPQEKTFSIGIDVDF